MTCRIEQRLRKLEVAASGPPGVRIVWSDTSDEAKCDRQIAETIDSGWASTGDEFMRIGWLPTSTTSDYSTARRNKFRDVARRGGC
jgi:hypothetical protein